MKFSFFHLMPYTALDQAPGDWPVSNREFDPEKAREYYRSYIDTMIYAEQCGFDWVGCNEHHFSPYGLMANCNVIGGALAYPTKRVRIAMMGNLVPLNNPLRIAEEYAMLDCMSGGRLIAGLMRGIPHEYIAYNIPPGESWQRQREGIALILKAWTEPEPFGWEGEHFRFRQVAIWPKPLQKPHPPLVISASSPESARFAGEMKATMGMVLISDLAMAQECIAVYKDAARGAGWEPRPENILVGMHTCIAEEDQEARALLSTAKNYFDRILMGGPRTAGRLVLQKTRYYQEEANARRMGERLAKREAATLEQQIDGGMIFCGSPQSVVKQMRRVHAELGNGVFNLTMKVGNLPDAAVRKGMELFRDRVLPEVRDL
ncbi:MAG TPA: LLM class flavin-dependent oxidoreductase [Burkholderiales bacterium]|nr:LLM class flavin-dependent oxidoreductase [Burkholderiales bacterium]